MIEEISIVGAARFSEDGLYRWSLTRRWKDGPLLTFVGLNPSTATATEDDPTIRRCIGFARREGMAGLRMLNLYAYRSTDPDKLRHVNDPMGVGNRPAWDEAFDESRITGAKIVCSWGVHGILHGGYTIFIERAQRAGAVLACLGKTKAGHPRHPLYLKSGTLLETFP